MIIRYRLQITYDGGYIVLLRKEVAPIVACGEKRARRLGLTPGKAYAERGRVRKTVVGGVEPGPGAREQQRCVSSAPSHFIR